jgi:site-specific recombinase XerD
MTVIEENESTWREWERAMRARRLSGETVAKHRRALEQLEASAGHDLLFLAKTDIQDWVAGMSGWKSSSVMTRFSSARAFYNWAEAEDLVGLSPMRKMKAPQDAAPLIPIPDIGDVRKVLAACKGRGFAELRDTAMIRLGCEPGGPRASEIARVPLASVDLVRDDVTVTGKGGKTRVFPLSATTATAFSRYFRARKSHPRVKLPAAFVGKRGAMTREGVYFVLERRCDQAGVARIHPHQLRHLAAHLFFLKGGREGDAMRLFGWDSPVMAQRYAAAAAASRAVDAARAMALGDDL